MRQCAVNSSSSGKGKRVMIRTVGVTAEERELDHVRGAHTGHELLDVLEAGLLELGTLGRIRRILN